MSDTGFYNIGRKWRDSEWISPPWICLMNPHLGNFLLLITWKGWTQIYINHSRLFAQMHISNSFEIHINTELHPNHQLQLYKPKGFQFLIHLVLKLTFRTRINHKHKSTRHIYKNNTFISHKTLIHTKKTTKIHTSSAENWTYKQKKHTKWRIDRSQIMR